MSQALACAIERDIRRALNHCRFWRCSTPRLASRMAFELRGYTNRGGRAWAEWLRPEVRWARVVDLQVMLAALARWPVRSLDDIRRGSYVFDCGSWSPSWDDICDWLSSCPPLVDIETFFVEQTDGWLHLVITGVEAP